MTADEFRKAGHRIIDWIADYRAGVESRPVMAKTAPGEIKAMLPASPPQQPESFDAILGDLDRIVIPGITTWQHPRFFGYFPSNALLSSVLGDYVSTGLGVIGLAWQSSPALTEVEEVVTDWMRQMLGFISTPERRDQRHRIDQHAGRAVGASAHPTTALARGGLQNEAKPLVVYTSAHGHSSVEKAALLAGFGKSNVRIVPHEGSHAIRPESLENMVKDDILTGRHPCAVVATTGTTTSTALDPIDKLASVARANNMWLHVDAAMAGSAMILPECRWMWQGVERADSVIVNAHKWLGAVFDCTIYFVRDPQHLVRVMSTNPSYLQSAADGRVKNYRDWGLPLGRRFRALKLWFLIREQGVEALQARLRRDIDNAKWLVREIAKRRTGLCASPVPLQTLCVRHEPPGSMAGARQAHTGWAPLQSIWRVSRRHCSMAGGW
jgi:aromatic-L-amino-acid decarboxylase